MEFCSGGSIQEFYRGIKNFDFNLDYLDIYV